MHINKNDIENFVSKELNDFQFSYDSTEWNRLNKKLSKRSLYTKITKVSLISIIPVLVILATLFFLESPKNQYEKESVLVPKVNSLPDRNSNTDNIITSEKSNPSSNAVTNNYEYISESAEDSTPTNKTTEISTLTKETVNQKAEQSDPVSVILPDNYLIPYFYLSERTGCSPFTVVCTPHLMNDSIIYLWEFSDGSISTEKSPVHVFKEAGEYSIQLTIKHVNSEKLYTWSNEDPVIVYSMPEVEFEQLTEENPFEFEVTSGLTYSYSWSIDNTEMYQGSRITHVWQKEGIYDITLTAESQNGCKNTETKTIEVDELIPVQWPTAFTPDGDGENDLYLPLVERENIVEYQLTIFSKQGMIVFNTTNPEKPWNGKVQGSNMECEFGVYVCILKVKDKHNVFKQYKRNVTIIK